MEVVRGHRSVPAWTGAAIAIGNFDGVHVGHRALIARARELAGARRRGRRRADVRSASRRRCSPAQARRRCCRSLERRLELLAEAGARRRRRRAVHARARGPRRRDAFVDDIVLGALRARAIVVGYDFTLRPGPRRHHRCAARPRRDAPASRSRSCRRSRSAARSRRRPGSARYLRAGDLRGRRAPARPPVGRRRRGRPRRQARPRDRRPDREHRPRRATWSIAPGIYAVTLARRRRPRRLPAVASLGTNPTFVDAGRPRPRGPRPRLATGDLYDRRVRTTFVSRIRDEQKFDSVDALIAQIAAGYRLTRARRSWPVLAPHRVIGRSPRARTCARGPRVRGRMSWR